MFECEGEEGEKEGSGFKKKWRQSSLFAGGKLHSAPVPINEYVAGARRTSNRETLSIMKLFQRHRVENLVATQIETKEHSKSKKTAQSFQFICHNTHRNHTQSSLQSTPSIPSFRSLNSTQKHSSLFLDVISLSNSSTS